MPAIDSKRLFAAVVFVGAVVVLAIQLINPSPVVVEVGEDGSEVVQVGEHYTERDVMIVALSACLIGASGTYLLTGGPAADTTTGEQATDAVAGSADPRRNPAELGGGSADANVVANGAETPAPDGTAADTASDPAPSDQLLEARKAEWEETAERLANKEQDVYEVVLEADGVLPQSDIVDRTDLSKASVSRALDGLEAKQLVERKRRGMGNVVILQ